MSVPDHASNILVDSPELVTQVGRKRLRSPSMQSDSGASSSSVKRSVADSSTNEIQIRSPRPDQPFSITSTDPNQDIDTYMAEQGEAEIPAFMPSPFSQSDASTQSISREEKLSKVQTAKRRRMVIGEKWYLVSSRWFKRFTKACTGEIDKEGPVTEQDLGPVNNSPLLDSYNNLLPSLAEGVDVEYVPQEVWDLLVEWYGSPVHPLPRHIIPRGVSKLPALELRPLRLKVFKLIKALPNSNTPHPSIEISAGQNISDLCTKLASAIAPDTETQSPYRIWRISLASEDNDVIDFLASQLSTSEANIIEESTKTLEEEGIESGDAFVVEFKQTAGWVVDLSKATKAAISDSSRPLFNSNENFFNKLSSSLSPVATSTQAYKPTFYDGLSSTASKAASTALTIASNKGSAKKMEAGTIGLGNMGNTCFMNSALQCLAHNQELTEYFLTGVYNDELNKDNPLGMGGAIAEAFGALLQRIWATSGSSSSYTPREFKTQLQRFAPQFTGYQQHDSQELVAFLLDGLHEDLNRVIKKPYVEKPDWEGGGDLELVHLAQKSWEGYMLRNDSVIVDLFQGQYQSTLICPECQKVSITFDPFMYLTLPLPIQKKWTHSIFYIPWDLNKPHVKIPVEINRDASFKDLRALLGRWMSAAPENLLTLEVFSQRFYKNLDDSVTVGEMGDTDTVVCFELPCNARQSRAYKRQPDDPFIVPVFLWDAKPPSTSGTYFQSRPNTTPFGYPMVVVFDQEQASDVNAMYDIVTERLRRWTEQARDLFAWEVEDSSEINEVPIHINGFPPIESITEFTEDGKVVTVQAVPMSEGDIVDESGMAVDTEELDIGTHLPLRKVGAKKDVFNLRLQINHKEFGTAYSSYPANNRWESWDNRLKDVAVNPVLLREDDALYCEFDEDKKAYFFGEGPKFEHALWNEFGLFTHPEFTENQKANAAKRHKGISLQDCLDEFTKEEQLGEDDLWYCPQCKKHQQATKKFDLWKVPDILVVHLKRFSNSRTLRDKIDAHVEFPIEGLDLSNMAGERNVAKRLIQQGIAVENLDLGNLGEPLLYDLFGVDEHMGGLGGGHYRAYAHNHTTDKWYHFDDSYVSAARPSDSVNANAYLLFYRRRTASHLGGKSFQKTQEAKKQPKTEPVLSEPLEVTIGTQLPTPPNEPADFSGVLSDINLQENDPWHLRSNGSNAGSSVPSPPTDDPPDFDDYRGDSLTYQSDPLVISTQRYDFPDPSNKASPTSSNEVEVDTDLDHDPDWESSLNNFSVGVTEVKSSADWDEVSNHASPSYSESSDSDPFSNTNIQKDDKTDTKPHAHTT